MPGALMWGYYPTDDKWVPLKVDEHGSIQIVCTVDELNDIGDVNVPSPSDDDVLYWDNAASKWQSKANWVAAHKTSHQNGGSDEIGVAGLFGLLADDQHVLDAEAVSAMGAKGDANPLHHDKYTNANAVSAMGAKADGNPLHHDRAAEWGATEHSAIGDAAPHHTKYTDAAAKAAAVLAGAITNGETKAPTHDAVYDVKVTADAAQTAAEVANAIAALAIVKSLLTERGSVIFRNATVPAELLHGTAGQVLQSGGHGADPSWASAPGGTKIQDADADTSWDTEESADEDKIHGKVKGVEAFLLHDDGILDLVKQSSCKAYRATTDQSIASSTPVKVQLNGEAWDVQSEFDSTTNYKFTAKKAGTYFVVGTVVILDLNDGNYCQALIYVNGAATDYAHVPLGAAANGKATVAAILSLAIDDYVELYARHDYGSNRDVYHGISQTSLSIQKLA